MKITLRGKNIEITEAIEEKVSEKLSKLDKYFIVSENVEAKVLVRTYPYGQKIEVTIPTEYVLLRAEVVDQDLYNAIDLVIDKLEGQIRKYKTRLNRKSKDNKLAFNLASIEPLEEEEEDVLRKRMKELGLNEKDYEFYLDLRKYGTARHAGFGLGFERMIMYLTGMGNIRDVIPFPRTVNNCEL